MHIVPPYIPWPRGAVLVVTPAHVYVLQPPGLFPSVPYWALVLRLPLQVALLAVIAWIASRPVDSSSRATPLSRA
jgi:uncharacterized membrane protein